MRSFASLLLSITCGCSIVGGVDGEYTLMSGGAASVSATSVGAGGPGGGTSVGGGDITPCVGQTMIVEAPLKSRVEALAIDGDKAHIVGVFAGSSITLGARSDSGEDGETTDAFAATIFLNSGDVTSLKAYGDHHGDDMFNAVSGFGEEVLVAGICCDDPFDGRHDCTQNRRRGCLAKLVDDLDPDPGAFLPDHSAPVGIAATTSEVLLATTMPAAATGTCVDNVSGVGNETHAVIAYDLDLSSCTLKHGVKWDEVNVMRAFALSGGTFVYGGDVQANNSMAFTEHDPADGEEPDGYVLGMRNTMDLSIPLRGGDGDEVHALHVDGNNVYIAGKASPDAPVVGNGQLQSHAGFAALFAAGEDMQAAIGYALGGPGAVARAIRSSSGGPVVVAGDFADDGFAVGSGEMVERLGVSDMFVVELQMMSVNRVRTFGGEGVSMRASGAAWWGDRVVVTGAFTRGTVNLPCMPTCDADECGFVALLE